MMANTHAAFAFLLAIAAIRFINIENQVLFVIMTIFFSLLPDIDKVSSKIGRKMKIASFIIETVFGHRGLFHSIWIPLTLFTTLIVFDYTHLALAISVGYTSHILLDTLTPAGVRIFYPLEKKIRGFISTGSLLEYALFIIFIGLGAFGIVLGGI